MWEVLLNTYGGYGSGEGTASRSLRESPGAKEWQFTRLSFLAQYPEKPFTPKIECPQIVTFQSLDIFKQRAYLKGSGEAIPSLRWQEEIAQKEVWGLFQIYDDVPFVFFFLPWAFLNWLLCVLLDHEGQPCQESGGSQPASGCHFLLVPRVSNTEWLFDLDQ